MPSMTIKLDGDGAWPEIAEARRTGKLIEVKEEIEISALPLGMVGGRTSIAFKIPLPDGRIVFAETSLRLLLLAADAFRAKYGDQLNDPTAHAIKSKA